MHTKTHKIAATATVLITVAHMVTDTSQGAFPALIPVIKETFSLNYSQVGFLVFLQSLTSSICQPLFGIIVDKKSRPWFIPLGVLLSGLAMGAIVFAPGYVWLIVLIAVSGFGAAIFHPQSLKAANRLSSSKKKGRNVGIFSVGGNLGFALGAFLIGILLSLKGGLDNVLWIALPAVLLTPLLLINYKQISLVSQIGEKHDMQTARESIPCYFLSVLVLFIFIRSTVFSGISTYTPLYHVTYLGQNSIFTGNYLSIFSVAGVLGTLAGGLLSDRWGRKSIIVGSMLITAPLVYLIPYVQGIGALILSGLIGFTIIASFTPMMVMAQEAMKKNMGLAAGLTAGLGIGLGGLGATILGTAADWVTLPVMLRHLWILPLLAAATAPLFPGKFSRIGSEKHSETQAEK